MKKMAKTANAFGMIFFVMALATMILSSAGCDNKPDEAKTAAREPAPSEKPIAENQPVARPPRNYKVVHVIVALCDNENQGIAKVPAALGNGQDPDNNLYWGAMYGLRTFFRKSEHWKEIDYRKITAAQSPLLRRSVFRADVDGKPVYVVADAYDGSKMLTTLVNFLEAAGNYSYPFGVVITGINDGQPLTGEVVDMICFVGHNGMMDIKVLPSAQNIQTRPPANARCAVVLACKSDAYFSKTLKSFGCEPLVMTYGLMAPEAYTLDAIIRSWAAGDEPAAVRQKAAQAYAKYQKCSLPAAERLFGAR